MMPTQNALTSAIVKTMSSIELVAFINEGRKAHATKLDKPFPSKGHAELRHDSFLKKIEKHPGIESPKFFGQYTDSIGRTLKCYNLPEREARLMVMSESLDVQTKVLDRLIQLESTPTQPEITLANPIMNMIVQQAIQYDKLEQQQKELAAQLQLNTSMISATSSRVEQVAAIVGAQDPQYYSIKAYANVVGSRVDDKEASRLGKLATRISNDTGVLVGKQKDAVWGLVNSYHESVLEQVFETV